MEVLNALIVVLLASGAVNLNCMACLRLCDPGGWRGVGISSDGGV